MRTLDHRIELLKFLGKLFRDLSSSKPKLFRSHSTELISELPNIYRSNPWFTNESVLRVVEIWGETLTDESIDNWISKYSVKNDSGPVKKVMVIMAGNIPLVGFHDFLCTILSGHHFIGKLSSKDNILFPLIVKWIIDFDEGWKEYIDLTGQIIKDVDMLIATGSDNTSRILKQQFSDKTSIIRHNRNSIGIITGDESNSELGDLAKDILWYYGLGCRNISLLFIPDDYDLIELITILSGIGMELPEPYQNNLKYQKSIKSMHNAIFIDAGKLLLEEDSKLNSPLGTLHFTRYKDKNQVDIFRSINQENIQCVVGDPEKWNNVIRFGRAQFPELDDYADGIDTMEFLINLP